MSFRKVREQLKEYKKKKATKKLARLQVQMCVRPCVLYPSIYECIRYYILQEIGEFREHEKQRWKQFTQKVGAV